MKVVFLFLSLLIAGDAYSYVDLSLSYSQSTRRVEGVETDLNPDPGDAITTSKGYSVNWAWYLWDRLAIEVNYGSSSERIVDDRSVSQISDGKTTTINQLDSVIETETIGAGLKLAFADRKAVIIPSLSLGYAKYKTSGKATYDITIDGTDIIFEQEEDEETFNSSYAQASIRFRFTEYIGLTIAAKTVMPDFETSEAANNITYQAGLSWVF